MLANMDLDFILPLQLYVAYTLILGITSLHQIIFFYSYLPLCSFIFLFIFVFSVFQAISVTSTS